MKPMLQPRARGFSLVELMIAMALGLGVIGAVLYTFASNRQAYRATEGLSRVQENTRIAFELLARDVRQAASIPCGRTAPVANVLNGVAGNDWQNWANAFIGYDGGDAAFPYAAFGAGAGDRVAATDAIQAVGGSGQGAVVTAHNTAAATLTLQGNPDGLRAGDIAMVCDNNQAAVFQVSAVAGNTISHAAGGVPGNCSTLLGFRAPFCGPGVPAREFPANSLVVPVTMGAWYVGCNGRPACGQDAGRSLFRVVLQNNAGAVGAVREEIVEGVRDLQIDYLVEGGAGYVAAGGVADWSTVTSARIRLTLTTTDTGREATPTVRDLVHVVNLRNRVQ